jgi:hypothetical protein
MRIRDVTFNENKLYDPTNLDIGYALHKEIAKFMKLMKTLDAEMKEYKIDDEIKGLNTIMIINPTASKKSPTDSSMSFFIDKATPSSHLSTPNHTLEPDNNASTSLISANFNA